MAYEMYSPEVVEQIQDIKQIYDINDTQADELDEALESVNDDLFYETMGIELIQVYEKLLDIAVSESDTLDERRTRIMTQLFNSTPYTLKDIEARLAILAPEGFELEVNTTYYVFTCKIALQNKKYLNYVKKMLDQMVPVNLAINAALLYNTWTVLGTHTCDELTTLTYKGLREDVLDT